MRGKAPLRISFSGGGTDLNKVFEDHGGLVINATINKFCHMTIKLREDFDIFINDKILSKEEPLALEVINSLNPSFGFDLWYYNDIPPGTGLGNSSSFIVLLTSMLLELQNKKVDDQRLVEIAYAIESKNRLGGWQDQYATTIGGFNFMEFNKETKTIYPLRLKYSTIRELEECLTLCYVGGEHDSGEQQKKNKIEKIVDIVESKEIAKKIKECLLNNKVEDIGILLKRAWEIKRNEFTTNETIDNIYKVGLTNGAIGGKLLGSGQSGFILFFSKPEDKPRLIERLKSVASVEDFQFTNAGVETWE